MMRTNLDVYVYINIISAISWRSLVSQISHK